MKSAPANMPHPDSDDILAWVAYCGGDTFAFQRELGGQVLYIPRSLTDEHRIARAIGLDAATRLCRELAGNSVSVPSRGPQDRRDAVLILSLAKLGMNQIGAAIGLHARSVMRIRSQLRDEGFLPRRAIKADNIYENERN